MAQLPSKRFFVKSRRAVASPQEVSTRKIALLYSKPGGRRRPEVGEAVANAEVARLCASYREERDAFAGVVGAGVGWIVTVIRGDNEQVFFCKSP
jgi:hypothetical protein